MKQINLSALKPEHIKQIIDFGNNTPIEEEYNLYCKDCTNKGKQFVSLKTYKKLMKTIRKNLKSI